MRTGTRILQNSSVATAANMVFAKAGQDKLFSAAARYQSLVMGVTVQ